MIKALLRSPGEDQVGGGWSRRSRKRSRLLLRRLLIVAGVVVLLLLLARPVRSLVHRWQAHRHAANALAYIEERKWKEAHDEAIAAYLLRPGDPQAIRAVATLLSRLGDSGALEFWQRLAEQAPLTRSNLRDKAAVAIKVRDEEQARKTIEKLLDKNAQAADWLLAAQLAIQDKNFDEAYNQVNKVFASASASNAEQVQAVNLLETISRSRSGALDPVVVRRLGELARGRDDAALDALTLLAYRHLDGRDAAVIPGDLSDSELINLIQSHPLVKISQQLVAASLLIHSKPSDRETILKETIDRWKSGDNTTLSALAGWLNAQREFQRELDVISEKRAMQTRDLFAQYVDALSNLGRWQEIRNLIENEEFPLDPAIEHMYLAECLTQQGEINSATNNWQRALEEAAGDGNKLMALADYAEKHGANETAMSAYEAALSISPRLRNAQQGRLRVAGNQHDTKKLHSILFDILRTWPNDPAAQSDEALIALLQMPAVGAKPAELEAIKETAQTLIQREPNSMAHRTVLALAFLRAGQPEEAMRVFAQLRPTNSPATPATLVVYAAVLAANNHLPEARQMAAKIPQKDLLPEEKVLTTF